MKMSTKPNFFLKMNIMEFQCYCSKNNNTDDIAI